MDERPDTNPPRSGGAGTGAAGAGSASGFGRGRYRPIDFTRHASYFDLSALWSVGTGTTLRAGINNIFDKDPPLISTNVSGTGGPNSYPTYDILGRQAFFGFSQKF